MKAKVKTAPLQLHYSFAVAMAIVTRIRIPASIKDRVTVFPWPNGREQGVHIRILPRRDFVAYGINIAQQRSSDAILLVHGPGEGFDDKHQHFDELYDNPRAHLEFSRDERGVVVRLVQDIIKLANLDLPEEDRLALIDKRVGREKARQERKHLTWLRKHGLRRVA